MATLVLPALEMEEAYLDFVRDWEEAGEEIVPYSARLLGRDYSTWLADDRAIQNSAPEGFVTAHTLFYMAEGGAMLGAINIRHELSDYLSRFGGNIGYGVRPSARKKGYATDMLGQGLAFARQLGMDKALITCDKANLASARTIQAHGGVLESEVENEEEGEITQRYWILL